MSDKIEMDISNKKHITMELHSKDGIGMNVNTGGGTKDHSKLKNRDLPDQHPIDAITGLREALDNIVASSGIYIGDEEPVDPNILIWIDTSTSPTPPIIDTQLITADDKKFITANNEIFILNEEEVNTLLTSDNKVFIEANNKKYMLKEEY